MRLFQEAPGISPGVLLSRPEVRDGTSTSFAKFDANIDKPIDIRKIRRIIIDGPGRCSRFDAKP
jgi:hypothetical protein